MSAANQRTSPDYLSLVKFLVTPFLESPDTLKVDCEQFNNQQRVWLRLAFNAEDRGKVYGRGGRNIQAIRNLLQASAMIAGQSLNLEIHEENSSRRVENSSSRRVENSSSRRVNTQATVSGIAAEDAKLTQKPRTPPRSPSSNKYSLS